MKIGLYQDFKFEIEDLKKIISPKEEKVLDDFLNICIELSMIKLKDNKYVISNNMLKTYFELSNLKNSY
ncbi:MAG: hypothetical protein E7Z84_07175 [Methanosphaera stadtmanae]|nr:hypothetical protein [Methanosphaera stadtmanae]